MKNELGDSMHEIERILRALQISSSGKTLRSPPDIFAVVGYFARISGCYLVYATPSKISNAWVVDAAEAGKAWREVLDSKQNPKLIDYPELVTKAWNLVCSKVRRPIDVLSKDESFVHACLKLIVATDEACVGVGVPSTGRQSYFELLSEIQISVSGTLCRWVPPESLRVLPKQHTPQSGFNIRSLTHNLALCTVGEVSPVWAQVPVPHAERVSYNILLAPWPLTMSASDFSPSRRISKQDGRVGYFDYAPARQNHVATVRTWLSKVLQRAKAIGQKVDLIVFPEAALNLKQWRSVAKVATSHGASIVSGTRSDEVDLVKQNSLRFRTPFIWQEDFVQPKHHRWRIDEHQISAYRLGGTLDRSKAWWENIGIQERSLHFIAVRPELVICPLICEDLARQDPVAEMVRSVGPNLVIALLMDGPQLPQRWSARYASVLADDPGSSVLTISSLGMVQLSKPRGCTVSRVFASWKDSLGEFTPLELGAGESALVLNLQFKTQVEWSVDGRCDGGAATTPILCGIHPIELQ